MNGVRAGSSTWPAVVFFLTRGPRTILELEKLTGTGHNAIRKMLQALLAEGLVSWAWEKRKPGHPSGSCKIWSWVPAEGKSA